MVELICAYLSVLSTKMNHGAMANIRNRASTHPQRLAFVGLVVRVIMLCAHAEQSMNMRLVNVSAISSVSMLPNRAIRGNFRLDIKMSITVIPAIMEQPSVRILLYLSEYRSYQSFDSGLRNVIVIKNALPKRM